MNWLAQAVGGMSDESARRQNIMTLGELRAALKMMPPETPVTLDNGAEPSNLHSYRGYYERLSIGTVRHRDDYPTEVNRYGANRHDPDPAVADVTIAAPVTAAEMVKALDLADGLDFGGYKGGTYWMDANTWIHVAERGEVGRAVMGVEVNESRGAVIVTGEYSW